MCTISVTRLVTQTNLLYYHCIYIHERSYIFAKEVTCKMFLLFSIRETACTGKPRFSVLEFFRQTSLIRSIVGRPILYVVNFMSFSGILAKLAEIETSFFRQNGVWVSFTFVCSKFLDIFRHFYKKCCQFKMETSFFRQNGLLLHTKMLQ